MSFNPTDIVGAGGIDDSRFKPWWEKVIEYNMRGMLVTSLLILYIESVAKPIQCAPKYPSANLTLTSEQAALANEFCNHQRDIVLDIAGVVSLAMAIALYACFAIWLLSSRVITILTDINHLDNTLRNEYISTEDIEDAIRTPRPASPANAENQNQQQVNAAENPPPADAENQNPSQAADVKNQPDLLPRIRQNAANAKKENKNELAKKMEVIGEMYKIYVVDKLKRNYDPQRNKCIICWDNCLHCVSSKSKIAACYILRCILALVVSIGIAGVASCFIACYHPYKSNSSQCVLSDEQTVTVGTSLFLCSSDLNVKIFPFAVIYVILSLVALGMSVAGICYATRLSGSKAATFIIKFNQFSCKLNDATLRILDMT